MKTTVHALGSRASICFCQEGAEACGLLIDESRMPISPATSPRPPQERSAKSDASSSTAVRSLLRCLVVAVVFFAAVFV
jgi:hypothetical protein